MKNKALIGIDLKNDIMKNESGATGCVKSTSYDPANWVVGPQIVICHPIKFKGEL